MRNSACTCIYHTRAYNMYPQVAQHTTPPWGPLSRMIYHTPWGALLRARYLHSRSSTAVIAGNAFETKKGAFLKKSIVESFSNDSLRSVLRTDSPCVVEIHTYRASKIDPGRCGTLRDLWMVFMYLRDASYTCCHVNSSYDTRAAIETDRNVRYEDYHAHTSNRLQVKL